MPTKLIWTRELSSNPDESCLMSTTYLTAEEPARLKTFFELLVELCLLHLNTNNTYIAYEFIWISRIKYEFLWSLHRKIESNLLIKRSISDRKWHFLSNGHSKFSSSPRIKELCREFGIRAPAVLFVHQAKIYKEWMILEENSIRIFFNP